MQSCNETFNIEFSVSITNHISESAHHLWKLLIHPAAQSRTIEATPTVTSFIDKYSVTWSLTSLYRALKQNATQNCV